MHKKDFIELAITGVFVIIFLLLVFSGLNKRKPVILPIGSVASVGDSA